MTDIWQYAKEKIGRMDLEMARSLGFDHCQQCGEWFHLGKEGWLDCLECGRHCPTCAESVDWEWCPECGLHYCRLCVGGADDFACAVCAIEYRDN